MFRAYEFVPDPEDGRSVYRAPDGERILGRESSRLIYSVAYTWEQFRDRDWSLVVVEQEDPNPTPVPD